MFLDIHSGIETGSTIETKQKNRIVETMGKKNINQREHNSQHHQESLHEQTPSSK
jgi:hypothetical protein